MKNIIFVLSVLLCFSLLVFGKMQYDNKLKGIAQEAHSTFKEIEPLDTVEQRDQVSDHVGSVQFRGIHPELQDKLISAVSSNQSVRVAFVGSNALTSDNGYTPWPDLVIQELNETYGEDVFEVTVFEVGNRTTHQVLETGLHNEIADFQPDVLLFEPLILNDNNNLTIDVTLQNLTAILTDIRAVASDVFIVLQPPNPIYRPNYYLEQTRELKSYAEENGYTYLDHWEAWPSITDNEIQDYIDGTRPNQKGHEIWASSIVEFFKGEE
ncbi:SGNH/GDSL hydrolase family protein [Alkalihalobacterium chitinilyticum]|uniref:SGNH/GDSL hydrolase family protein n=1 Tax=Alkalihalobacterium chitinilyticum TaxID=2980103 RepID=A0ABT5VEY9_9BACI|nr:SGNH/GDSL hydrolase family protein [Alkalihalobacterium chitinilyticum]MDE5414026.1 SGNH/GDSL hydrolase family protein [Alkalihalobacterium chitinilyticum]